MTTQASETIILDGEHYSLFCYPLYGYLHHKGIELPESSMSLCCRGYLGTWTIDENRLYLLRLSPLLTTDHPVGLGTVFPDRPGRVFADWYSGVLNIGVTMDGYPSRLGSRFWPHGAWKYTIPIDHGIVSPGIKGSPNLECKVARTSPVRKVPLRRWEKHLARFLLRAARPAPKP